MLRSRAAAGRCSGVKLPHALPTRTHSYNVFAAPQSALNHACVSLNHGIGKIKLCTTPRGRSVLPGCRAATVDMDVDMATMSDMASDSDDLGPAFRATLRMLDWPRLCSHVAEFASTHVGKQRCMSLAVPCTQQESEQLLAQTRWGKAWMHGCMEAWRHGGTQAEPHVPKPSIVPHCIVVIEACTVHSILAHDASGHCAWILHAS